MLPRRVAQSQNVGAYMAQLEGTKSRCRLVKTMTKRSSHMPMFADNATKNRARGLVRILRDQSSCGIAQLSAMRSKKANPYGPKMRFFIMYCSKTSPLYQAMNA